MRSVRLIATGAVVLGALAAGCGTDDGADVRDIGGSTTGSATTTPTGTPTGTSTSPTGTPTDTGTTATTGTTGG